MPNSGDPWKDAEALASAHVKRTVEKRTDELPYVFHVSGMRSVLVHNGRVVTETGPQVAADYLRDIGIVKGPGPSIESVLHVLWLLRAGPEIEGLHEEGYILSKHERMKEITAQVKRTADSAQIVLHWFLDEGGGGGDSAGPQPRPVTRAVLAIGAAGGKAAWEVQDTEWTPTDVP